MSPKKHEEFVLTNLHLSVNHEIDKILLKWYDATKTIRTKDSNVLCEKHKYYWNQYSEGKKKKKYRKLLSRNLPSCNKCLPLFFKVYGARSSVMVSEIEKVLGDLKNVS